jgi:hypothetical protein
MFHTYEINLAFKYVSLLVEKVGSQNLMLTICVGLYADCLFCMASVNSTWMGNNRIFVTKLHKRTQDHR